MLFFFDKIEKTEFLPGNHVKFKNSPCNDTYNIVRKLTKEEVEIRIKQFGDKPTEHMYDMVFHKDGKTPILANQEDIELCKEATTAICSNKN